MSDNPNAITNADEAQPNPNIVIDLSQWHMLQYLEWMRLGSLDTENKIKQANIVLATVVKSWPFRGDPTNPDSYLSDLYPWEWAECLATMKAKTKDAFRRPGMAPVSLAPNGANGPSDGTPTVAVHEAAAG